MKRKKLVRAANNGNWIPVSCIAIVKSLYGGKDVDGYYELLGVCPAASFDEIKNAALKMKRKTHPDAGGSHEDFVKVSQAASILLDPLARRDYDSKSSFCSAVVSKKNDSKKCEFVPVFYKESIIIVSDGFSGAWVQRIINALIEHHLQREIRLGFREGTEMGWEDGILVIGTGLRPENVKSTLLALFYICER